MNPFESIFYMLWRGAAIGLIISAPMGPVGILCIQRTLDKGRRSGFYTGVGAAISDFIYCLLTGFGLSFIEDFLERNSAVIQLIGSVVLIIFGIYLFRKNPAKQLKKPEELDVSTKTSILAGFLFTFSNPLILFLIIGLFARFNFLRPEIPFYFYIPGYIAIILGALGWWWLVTFFVDKVRAHFNLRSMWLINKIIGIIILGFALVGIITGITSLAGGSDASAARRPATATVLASPASPALSGNADRMLILNSRHGFYPLSEDSLIRPGDSGGVAIDAAELPLNLRVWLKAGDQPWTMKIGGDSGILAFDFSTVEKEFAISSEPTLRCRAILHTAMGDSLLAESYSGYGRNLSYRFNHFSIRRNGEEWTLRGGSHNAGEILRFTLPSPVCADSLYLEACGKKPLTLRQLDCSADRSLAFDASLSPWSDTALLEEYLANSEDPMEGYWYLLDRTLEESLLKLGGDYRLACVRSEDGYDLIYLEGARVMGRKWIPGMVKARLRSSGIDGVWNVGWTDATGMPMTHELKAQMDSPSTLTIYFPYQSSSLRFQQISKP